MSTDPLRYRRVWITRRKGGNRRRSNYCLNWVDDDGVGHRLAYETMALARRAAEIREAELNRWIRTTSAKAWLDVIVEYGERTADASKWHQYKVAKLLERVTTLVAPRDTSDLTPQAVERFLVDRAAGKPDGRVPSNSTRYTERQMLSDLCSWCVSRGYLAENPVASTAAPQRPKRAKVAPREADWLHLLESVPSAAVHDRQGWHVLILLGVLTGYRQSVLLHCYFGVDVADERRRKLLEERHRRDGGYSIVQVADSDERVGMLWTYSGKTMRERLVAIPPPITDRIISRMVSLPDGCERLFLWSHWQRKAWNRINDAAGMNITFQSLRSASGTQAAIAQAERAGSSHLEHSGVEVSRRHYLDAEAIARAVAVGAFLPPLPPLPAFDLTVPASTHGRRPRST